MVVRLQDISGCGKSTIKVQRKDFESKAYVQLKYGIIQSSTETFFGAYYVYWIVMILLVLKLKGSAI